MINEDDQALSESFYRFYDSCFVSNINRYWDWLEVKLEAIAKAE